VVNDTHGHAVGDKALCEFARRVSVIARADAFLARVGGDEFTIIMPKIDSFDNPVNLAAALL
jgi:diguanylate cyclase (GGDEF)-like protein